MRPHWGRPLRTQFVEDTNKQRAAIKGELPAVTARVSQIGAGKLSVEWVVLLVSATAAALFAITVEGFATLSNLENLARNSAPLLILSCAMGIVVIGRGLDLSQIAAMTAVTSVFGVLILSGHSPTVALLAAAGAAVLLGLINGWLIAYAEIPALLATLATAILFTGLGRWGILRGEYLLLLPKDLPLITLLSSGRVLGVPLPIVIAFCIAAITWFLLACTGYGRAIYASGDNHATARISGLPVRQTTLVVYVVAAVAASIAGLLVASASGTVDFRTVTNGTLLFEVIMVVVLGGISLRGGRGGLLSIVAGVALISVMRNGMTLMDLTTQVQSLVKGLTLIVAIVLDNHFNPKDPETDTVGDL
jgi:ribose transport system permease protein